MCADIFVKLFIWLRIKKQLSGGTAEWKNDRIITLPLLAEIVEPFYYYSNAKTCIVKQKINSL